MHDWQSAEMSSVGISNRFRTYSRDIVVGVRVHFVPRDGLGVLRRRGVSSGRWSRREANPERPDVLLLRVRPRDDVDSHVAG